MRPDRYESDAAQRRLSSMGPLPTQPLPDIPHSNDDQLRAFLVSRGVPKSKLPLWVAVFHDDYAVGETTTPQQARMRDEYDTLFPGVREAGKRSAVYPDLTGD